MRLVGTRQGGVTLIEVMVTLLILSIGLLGMAALQVRLQQSEMEAYQRAQALLLLSDMANRVEANRNAAESYVTGASSPVGVGSTCGTSTESRQAIDLGEWCDALQGAAETTSSASKVGALLGGRGCIESLGSGEYLITVVWQGGVPIAAPPASVACGIGKYDGGEDSVCANDLCRRVVTTIVRIADL